MTVDVRPERVEFKENVSVPSFTVNTTGLPDTFREINLLGLDRRYRNRINEVGINSISELSEAMSSWLPGERNFGPHTVREISDATTVFNSRIQSLRVSSDETSLDQPIDVNAKQWLERYDLTWGGLKKSPQILRIEESLRQSGQTLTTLGDYLVQRLQGVEAKTWKYTATEIAELTKGEVQLSQEQLQAIVEQYGISVEPMSWTGRRLKALAPESNFSIKKSIAQVRRNEFQPDRVLLQRAKEAGIVEGLLGTSETDLLTKVIVDRVPIRTMAHVLHQNPAIVSRTVNKALAKLRRELRRKEGEEYDF